MHQTGVEIIKSNEAVFGIEELTDCAVSELQQIIKIGSGDNALNYFTHNLPFGVCPLALGDVPTKPDQANDLFVLVTQGNLGGKQPGFLTLLANHEFFSVDHGLTGLDHHLVVGQELFCQLLRVQSKIILT